jgi:hypothetical protein
MSIQKEPTMNLEELRKELNPRQKALRQALTGENPHKGIALFLTLHGILHGSQVAPEAPWSYEDALLADLDEDGFRRIPAGEAHSVAWIVWHLSRIEDVTINLLVAGQDQVFETGGWFEKTRAPIRHTGNAMEVPAVRRLSQALDLSALREYRFAVGRATRRIVKDLPAETLSHKVDPNRLQQVLDQGAVTEEARGVVDYWGRRDTAGLLLMPPTRHAIIHWNEARRLITGR